MHSNVELCIKDMEGIRQKDRRKVAHLNLIPVAVCMPNIVHESTTNLSLLSGPF